MLQGKKILLGVTGSIAAYKAAFLVRLLVKAGADVQVVMSRAATTFITPLTLATLSKRPVLTEFVRDETGTWNNHVELGLWADALLIAPASARTLARCANGLADDLLTAVYLSARCPVFFAPAMDLDMYAHPSTTDNLRKLRSYGNQVVAAAHGELASGLVGDGRMAEPETLVQVLEGHFAQQPKLYGKRVLITAGPTQEAIDPVRFISNHSTGKMGYALAEQLALGGAQVTLVSGPAALGVSHPSIELVRVQSAAQMLAAVNDRFDEADVAIWAAAVADYTPSQVADQKIKKTERTFEIQLTKTQDIAAAMGQRKRPEQIVVGFALETNNELANALDKLRKKNFDLIVLNSLRDANAGFGYDTNKITVIDRHEQITHFELKPKKDVAQDIIGLILAKLA